MTREAGLWIDHRKAVIVIESILIIGPGEAKGELVKRLEADDIGGRIVGIETVDKMTDRQIAERVRQQFHLQKNALRR